MDSEPPYWCRALAPKRAAPAWRPGAPAWHRCTMRIRDARDDDAAGLIELIGSCWSAYPGCVLDVDGEMPHLRAVADAYRAWGGRAWIAEEAGRVVASIGLVPARGWQAGEVRMLYVLPAARRAGLGSRLLALAEAEAEAAARGAVRIELWSDTRFTDAHRFYLRHGYTRGPDSRELHDLSDSVEHFFFKLLRRPLTRPLQAGRTGMA